MRFLKPTLLAAAALFVLPMLMQPASASTVRPNNAIYLDLKDGRVVIRLLPTVAPEHVKRLRELSGQGFYDGHKFHRVIDGFMAQTGDPTGTGRGGSKLPDLRAEFSDLESFTRGAVGMARNAGSDHSANSQFFIVLEDSPFLDGKYTLWGRVVEGMEFVDNITKGEPPRRPDTIVRMRVGSDAIAEDKQKKEAN